MKHVATTLLLVFAVGFGGSLRAEAKVNSDEMKVVADETLSQAIRSNAVHYWSFVAKLPPTTALKAFDRYQGIVVGDPHLGNFSVIPVSDKSGTRQMRFVDIDFDDAGVGPFAFDVARFVLTVKATDGDIKIKDLLEAYRQGLGGHKVAAPQIVQDSLAMGISMYDRLDAEYVDKKTSHDQFRLKAGEIEKYSGKHSGAQIAALFPGEKILDLATRPRERGGSANAIRYWVLLKGASQNRIVEIKGYDPTALGRLQPQKPAPTLASDVHAALWPGLDASAYDLKQLGGDLVWVRAKKVALFDVPYGVKKPGDKTFVAALSLFDANYLGLLHGSQPGARGYAAAIEQNPDAFRDAVKDISGQYLDIAKQTLK